MADDNNNPTFERIEQEITDHSVVLFMKGTPIFPQCGFSAMVVQVLTHLGVQFKSVDVLNEPAVREGIKKYSNWPTIPQLYIKKEFVGGCDIIKEIYENGELKRIFEDKKIVFKK